MNTSKPKVRRGLRIIGGTETARVVVEPRGGEPFTVPDRHTRALHDARAEGERAGRAEAEAEAAARQLELETQIGRLTEQLPRAWQACVTQLEHDLRDAAINVAFQIAERIVRTPVCSCRAVQTAVEEAFALPLLDRDMQVHCHPDDLRLLQTHTDIAADSRLTFAADATLAPGDVRLATRHHGDLDGCLTHRLQALEIALRETLPAAGTQAP